MTMREDLADWCDWDEAAHSYGIAIGVFEGTHRRQVTRILLSDNPLGGGLHAGMLALVAAGVVERREEPDEQFRWIFPGTQSLADSELRGLGVELPVLHDIPEAIPEAVPDQTRHWWQRG